MIPSPLNLKDAFQDPPHYRAHLEEAHLFIQGFDTIISSWVEKARDFVSVIDAFSTSTSELMVEAAKIPSNTTVDFVETISKLNNSFVLMDEKFITTMEAEVIEPLQKFQNSLKTMLADAKNGLFNASEEYEASLNEYSSTPSSKCLRRDETAKALYLAKEKLCYSSVHYATVLNEIPAIRETFVMEKISSLLLGLSAWATKTQTNIETSVPLVKSALECIEENSCIMDLKSLKLDAKNIPDFIEAELLRFRHSLGMVESEERLSISQTSESSLDLDLLGFQKKSGYLLQRKPNCPGGWVRYYYHIQLPEGLFIQASEEYPLIIDLRSSSIRESECEGRSFVFEISTPPVLTNYFQAETEADMMEWIYALRMQQKTDSIIRDSSSDSGMSMPLRRPSLYRSTSFGSSNSQKNGSEMGSEAVKSGSLMTRELKNWKSSSIGKDPLSLPSSWRKIVLIVRSNGILYQFNEQDKTVIENIKLRDIYRNHIQMIDESALKKKNCFYLRTKHRVYFFMAENLNERNEWVAILKTFAQPEVLGISDDSHFCYRLDRTFWLRVVDARNIGQCDPYCIVEMDGERRAKTSVKNRTNAPYWREDFYFSDIPVLNRGVDVTLMNHNKLHKDAYMGKITIPLGTIRRGEYYEGWYPIMHESKVSHHPPEHVGDLRLRLRYDEVVVLPSANYEELVEMILDVESKVVFDLVGISKNLEWFSENMMRIYEGRNYAIEWLTYLAYHEVNSTDDSNILFRGNSILTKAIDSYMKMIGLQYVDEAIGNIVRSICENKIVCEVDMMKLEKGQDIRSQWRILLTYTKMLWQAIEKSRAKCPCELRVFFSNLRTIITDKFASELDKSLVRYTCVSGFLFLRLFCPAVLSPKLFNLVKEHPDAKTRRTLTLLAKSLQCLANLADFGSKEPYMIHMNEFIRQNATSLMEFIDYVSLKPIAITSPSRILPPYQSSESFFLPPQIPYLVDIDKELSNFSNFIALHLEDLQLLINEGRLVSAPGVLERLLSICCRLNEKTSMVHRLETSTNGITIPRNLDCRVETPCSSEISQA
ncbi:hypothetical protein K7432_001828 [Basidiobolus ranarum]|uniref:Ras GTPase-activating protein n=1 Tax=Basidiobolus ranarum TaxID=34480 RepID=A0ABR2W9H0_9FUNG